jgi:photosystem II stability/assembly factor-like uncharacterized protein
MVVALFKLQADSAPSTAWNHRGNLMRARSTFCILIAILLLHSQLAIKADYENPRGEVRRWEITGPWGGDVRSLVVSPDNPDLLYLGTSDGQIFRSSDGALTWHRLKPGLGKTGLSVDNLVIDARNTKTIYAGAWAVSHDGEGGVFKSEDGGEHWKLLEGTRGFSVRSLALAPSDSNLLIAGTANDNPKLNGVFRSTDGGKTWQRISPEGDKEIRNIESVAISPISTDTIYVGTYHLPWKTTDGGKTWKQTGYKAIGVIDDSDIFGICINPNDPNLIYLNACSGIYRSTSGGEKWTKLPGIPFSARRTYALLPHPTNPNVIFAGTSEGLWRTKDGGKKWMLLTSRNLVIRAILVHPDKPNRVLIGTDAFGVMVSNNLGDDFVQANTGFIHRHILAIMPDLTEHGRILASVFHDGEAGSVFLSTDGGLTWQPSSRGLGSRDVYTFYQLPDNPEVIYVGTNTGVFRSTDRGATWSYVGKIEAKAEKPRTVRRKSRPKTGSSTARSTRQKVLAKRRSGAQKRSGSTKKETASKPTEIATTPLVELNKSVDDITGFFDENGRRGLLAATVDGLYRTFDETKGWEKITIPGYDPNGRVFAVSTHKDAPKLILVGTRQGLFISRDGGASWSHVERGPSDISVKAIAQSPRDPNLILLGTNYFVYRSTNGGRSWSPRAGGLPPGDYTAVVFNPANPDEVLVADYSRGGVYRSMDKGYSWERIDAELPSSRVWTLSFDPFERDRIYAGSFSSGVYVLTIQRGESIGQN